jgi:Zn-dependent protease with chaperone function
MLVQAISAYHPPPDIYQKSAAYSAAHYRHYCVGVLYGTCVLLAILHWRLGPRYRDWAERLSSRRWVQLVVYAPAILLTVAVAGLPVDAWDHGLDRRFGISVQGWASWASDWITNQIVVLLVGTLLVGILYGVIRRSARRWWLVFWVASIPLLVAGFYLQPLVIDPLFFTFTPLAPAHPELAAELQQVVRHGGVAIPPERMFVMNASSKTTSLNAYVTGFGASKRAVIWDTTIEQATTPEVLFVFGHEMGHYVLHHVPIELALTAVGLLVLMCLADRLARWMLERWGHRWEVRGLADWASLPLLLLVVTTLGVLATPAANTMSRHFEHEADRYGLEVIHGIVPDQGQVAAHYFEHSGEINLADPDPGPVTRLWMFDHPTRPERVRFAATYDPWGHGESPRYVH